MVCALQPCTQAKKQAGQLAGAPEPPTEMQKKLSTFPTIDSVTPIHDIDYPVDPAELIDTRVMGGQHYGFSFGFQLQHGRQELLRQPTTYRSRLPTLAIPRTVHPAITNSTLTPR